MDDKVVKRLMELTDNDSLEWSAGRTVTHDGTKIWIDVQSSDFVLVSNHKILSRNAKLLAILLHQFSLDTLLSFSRELLEIQEQIMGWK